MNPRDFKLSRLERFALHRVVLGRGAPVPVPELYARVLEANKLVFTRKPDEQDRIMGLVSRVEVWCTPSQLGRDLDVAIHDEKKLEAESS